MDSTVSKCNYGTITFNEIAFDFYNSMISGNLVCTTWNDQKKYREIAGT